MTLVTMSIKYLKDTAVARLKGVFGGTLDESGIQFVVTVPAIWEDAARQFMREASEKVKVIVCVDCEA